nr:F-box domain, leucine-rich repeat domain, L domain-like protein [Tanacetum cinerariifolium]
MDFNLNKLLRCRLCEWFDTCNQGRKVKRLVLRNNTTQIDTRADSFKDDQYILVTQVKQVFYLEDTAKPYWRVVEHVNHKKFFDGGVIVVEDDPDIIHFDNSSDLPLFTSLNDLDNATLHIDGQSTEVDAPSDIIDMLPGPKAVMVEVRITPLHTMYPAVAWVGKGKRKPNLGGKAAGRLNTRDKTRNLSLKEIMDKKGPVPIQFELRDKQTFMPLSDHATHWSSYIGEVIRGVPLYYPSWLKVLKERKATLITDIGTQFDMRPHMESLDWTEINAGIQQHLQKAYNTNKAAFKAQHWEEMRKLEATGTYTDDEINRLARGGKQRGHIPCVGRVLPARATASPSTPAHESTLNSLHKKVDFMMSLFKSDSKYSYMFSQFESGGASGSGGCGDEEEGTDDQDDEDEYGDGDT